MMDLRQEEDVLPGRAIAVILCVALGVALLLGLWAFSLLRGAESRLRPSGRWPERTLPEPSEVSAIEQELFARPAHAEVQAREQRKQLETYGWIDRDRGTVRIPIDRAMELYLEREQRP